MKNDSIEEFLKRGGVITKCETVAQEPQRRQYTRKDKIDVAIGIKRRTGASARFDQFARAFLEKGNTSWKYGK